MSPRKKAAAESEEPIVNNQTEQEPVEEMITADSETEQQAINDEQTDASASANIPEEQEAVASESGTEKKTRSDVLREKREAAVERRKRNDKLQQEGIADRVTKKVIEKKYLVDVQILGVEELEVDNTRWAYAAGFSTGENRRKISIPFKEMYGDYESVIDMDTVDLKTSAGRNDYFIRQRSMLNHFIGLTIPVYITREIPDPRDPNEKMLIGSRKDAINIIKYNVFVKNKTFKEGDLCTGTIQTVGRHSLSVIFSGVEITIPQATLTYRYLRRLDEYYRVGNKLDFIIRDLVVSEDNVSFKADTKTAERNRYAERLKESMILYPRTNTHAIITSIKKSGQILAWLDMYELPMTITSVNANMFYREPRFADSVLVQVDRINRDEGMLVGHIVTILGGEVAYSKA